MVEAKIDTDKKILFILLLILLIGGIFGSYAYFSSKSENNTETVKTATFSLEFDDSNPIIKNENIIPIDDSDIFTKATKKHFTIQNTSTEAISIKLNLDIIKITEALKSPDFKWALYDEDNNMVSGNFENIIDNKINVIDSLNMNVNEIKTYDLYIWISNKDVPQDELQEGNLTVNITATASAIQ